MRVNSMTANKILRKLNEKRDELLDEEYSNHKYVAIDGEEPTVQEYDYDETRKRVNELNEKIVKIKHAINVLNTTNTISYLDNEITIDGALVKMAQLSQEKERLSMLKKCQPKRRKGLSYSGTVEYEYTTFDTARAKEDYTKVEKELTELQLALDKFNLTCEFDIDIEL